MSFTSELKIGGAVPRLASGPVGGSANRMGGWKPIFIGPNGLRAGWRLLIYAVLVVAFVGSFLIIRTGGVEGFREAQRHAGEMIVTPLLMGWSEGMAFVLVCVATLIMGKIEGRKFGEYGLPMRDVRRNLGRGCLWGFLAISGTMLTMFLLHAFRVTGLALHGTAILSSVMEWGAAFLVVGLCEEFLCRGYAQYTLASGIGFWPSALVMAGMFALGHYFNANETGVGVVATGLFALLHCLFLRRTGSLWIAVGFHASWDWGQTLYGIPDSGMLPYHSVFHSVSSGPRWLTGGTVGPEGSVLTPIALLIVALIFSRCYPRKMTEMPAQPVGAGLSDFQL